MYHLKFVLRYYIAAMNETVSLKLELIFSEIVAANRIIDDISFKLICSLLLFVLFVVPALSQVKPPDPKDYPVTVRDTYKGSPVAPLLDSRRARMYRTVLRQGVKNGPNFAGKYTIVTWGAGLGSFSMAVVDATSGKVHFPPFTTVYNTGFGMPFIDKGDNPAWSLDSRLFAFIGRPDVDDKGMGLYVYLFDRGQFSLLYFEKEDEDKRKAEQVEWEKELDRRMDSMATIFTNVRPRVSVRQPEADCYGGPAYKYPVPAYEIICTESDLIFVMTVEHHSTPEVPKTLLDSEVADPAFVNLREVVGLGEKGFGSNCCGRAWLRFRKGPFYVRLNANMNRDNPDPENCVDQQDEESVRLAEFSTRVALILAGWLE